jgi:hypothetical protein
MEGVNMTKKWVYLFNEVKLAEEYVDGEWDIYLNDRSMSCLS